MQIPFVVGSIKTQLHHYFNHYFKNQPQKGFQASKEIASYLDSRKTLWLILKMYPLPVNSLDSRLSRISIWRVNSLRTAEKGFFTYEKGNTPKLKRINLREAYQSKIDDLFTAVAKNAAAKNKP